MILLYFFFSFLLSIFHNYVTPLPVFFLGLLSTLLSVSKEIILFFCPFIVFLNVVTSLGSLKNQAIQFLLKLSFFEIFNNSLIILLIYFFFPVKTNYTPLALTVFEKPFFSLSSLLIISPVHSFLLATLLGLYFSYKKTMPYFFITYKNFLNVFIQKLLKYLIPFMILPCFLLFSFQRFSFFFTIIPLLFFVQQACIFLLNLFFFKKKVFSFYFSFKEPFLFALSSSSSLATLPLTIESSKKTLKNPSLAEIILPSFTNIQQIADCLLNAFLVLFFYQVTYSSLPSFTLWLIFTFHLVFIRFAGTGVSGGVIFLLLPLYQHYFHFDEKILSLILSLNIIFDPLVTAFNVLGNLSLSPIFEKLFFKKIS